MARLLILSICLGLAPGLAAARDPYAPFCDGKYALAQEMLDAAYGKYGTLYSGGEHFHARDNVGATLDLWRLWNGLPDLNLRAAGRYSPDWRDDPLEPGQENSENHRRDQIAWAIELVNAPDMPSLSERDRYAAAVVLDLATAGSGGWWLDPEAIARMTPGMQHSASLAARVPLIAWLYLLQEASAASSEPVWYAGSRRSFRPDWKDVAQQPDPRNALAFAAAAAAIEGGPSASDGVTPSGPVQSCAASPAEYALWAVQVLEGVRASRGNRSRDLVGFLPETMRTLAVTQMALMAVHDGDRLTLAERTDWLNWAAAQAPTAEVRAWVNVGRTYLAGTVDALVQATADAPLDARVMRALNVLSVQDLRAFAAASDRPAEELRPLRLALAAREFVLGDIHLARQDLVALAQDANAPLPEVLAALDGPGGEAVQVARALLALGQPSVWMRGEATYHYRDVGIAVRNALPSGEPKPLPADLPIEFVQTGFLDRDLNAWLLNDFAAYRGMRGSSIAALNRLRSRHDARTPYLVAFRASRPIDEPPFPFIDLIAAGEVQRLGDCTGLSRRLAEVIISWADQGTDGMFDHWVAPKGEMADALARIVRMGRGGAGVLIDTRPAGQVAFALLTHRFAETEAAQSVRYWYFKDSGCRP